MPEDIIKTALAQYEDSTRYYEDQRRKCLEDIKFAYVYESQWDESMVQKRRDRPRYTVNRIVHTLNIANGAYKQNQITGRVRGWKNNAQKQVADVLTGLIRNIENVSKADQIYADSYSHINSGGFSAWRVRADFNSADTFEQDLLIESIEDPWLSVWPDSSSRKFNSKDWDYCLITRDIAKARYERLYPKKTPLNFPDYKPVNSNQWISDETVKVAEYWRRVPVKRILVLLSDGSTHWKDEAAPVLDELANQGITVVKERSVDTNKVEAYIINGVDVLEGPFEWLGSWIPIIPAYGYRMFIDGEFNFRGKVRFAKDAQRIYNYTWSSVVEASALSPKDPIFLTAEQVRGFEERYKRFNLQNNPFLFYNADDKAPPPFKLGAPAVQTALIQQNQQAAQDIQATMGSFAPSQGQALSPDQSGEAIRALQQSADTGQFDLIDSLANSIEFTWETLVDVLPKIYDTERQERIINTEGAEESVFINKAVVDTQTGQTIILNDVTMGKYDVVIDIGTSVKTQRQEAVQIYGNILQTNPQLAQLIFDLFIKNLDIPNVEQVEKRARKQMLQQGLIEPNEEEAQALAAQQQQQQADPMAQLQALLAQEQFKKIQLENQEQELKNQELANKIDIEAEKTQAETSKTLAQAEAEYAKAQIPLRPGDLVARDLQNKKLIQNLQDTQSAEAATPAPAAPAVGNNGAVGVQQ